MQAQTRPVGGFGAAFHGNGDVRNFSFIHRNRTQDPEEGHRTGEVREQIEVEAAATDRTNKTFYLGLRIVLGQFVGQRLETFGDWRIEVGLKIDEIGNHDHDAVAVAEVLDPAALTQYVEQFPGRLVERLQECLMHDGEVISVGRILELDFPIAGKAELVTAGCLDTESGTLFHEQVDPFFCAAEKIRERLDVVLERRKDQAIIGLRAQGNERVIPLVEGFVIAFGARHGPQGAVHIVAPTVIRADEHARLACLHLADRSGTVAAAIEQDVNLPGLVACNENLLAADMGGLETVRLGQLTLVRDPHPGAAEDAIHLRFENRRIAIERGVHPVFQNEVAIAIGLSGHITLLERQ